MNISVREIILCCLPGGRPPCFRGNWNCIIFCRPHLNTILASDLSDFTIPIYISILMTNFYIWNNTSTHQLFLQFNHKKLYIQICKLTEIIRKLTFWNSLLHYKRPNPRFRWCPGPILSPQVSWCCGSPDNLKMQPHSFTFKHAAKLSGINSNSLFSSEFQTQGQVSGTGNSSSWVRTFLALPQLMVTQENRYLYLFSSPGQYINRDYTCGGCNPTVTVFEINK